MRRFDKNDYDAHELLNGAGGPLADRYPPRFGQAEAESAEGRIRNIALHRIGPDSGGAQYH